jgi:hypothetical protein
LPLNDGPPAPHVEDRLVFIDGIWTSNNLGWRWRGGEQLLWRAGQKPMNQLVLYQG